jgi:aryl-alcohol dehydrogenase-like predicted oxidoreductase
VSAEASEQGSRIGLGLAAAARPAYITPGRDPDLGPERGVEQLRARCEALLDAAYAAGVRYVDVARSYGRAEEFLAGWLATRPAATDVVVGSKWGYRYVGDWQLDAAVHEVKDHSLAAFTRQLELSVGLLGNRLGVYHLHSLTPDSPALTDRALHRALATLRERGVRVGFSTSGPAQADVVRAAIRLTADGAPLFSSVESTWNLLEPSAGPALVEAADAGMTVIVKEAVANGRLVPGVADPAPAARAARELAERRRAGLDQVATAAALAQPWAWRVLSGAVTTGQLEQNLGAGHVWLTAEEIAAVTSLAPAPEEYWSDRSARRWS